MTDLDLSIIIVNWNTQDLLRACLLTLAPIPPNWELLVVDNASADDSAKMVRTEFPHARLIINSRNRGYSAANNQGLTASKGRYALLLNSDTLAERESLTGMVAFMDHHPAAGAMSPLLLRPDNTSQPYSFGQDPTLGYLLRRGLSRVIFRQDLHEWATESIQTVDWISGACMMVRREAIDQVGLLDEDYFMYFEDNDWCLRMRNHGWSIYYVPDYEVIHLGGQSSKQSLKARAAYYKSLKLFYKKHYSRLQQWLLELLLKPYLLIHRSIKPSEANSSTLVE